MFENAMRRRCGEMLVRLCDQQEETIYSLDRPSFGYSDVLLSVCCPLSLCFLLANLLLAMSA